MKVLVTGAKGQLGYDVVKELNNRNFDVVSVDIDEMDITDYESVKSVLNAEKPDAVIHCAAWTAVDAAEDEENYDKVFSVNVTGTENIAKVCKDIDAKMLYISTDYVFDGEGVRPWEPDDERTPLNIYGKTKCEGEYAVEKYLEKFFIVRISWVFGVNGNNFVKTMLRLGKTHNNLTVVNDQVGSPTYTPDLAKLFADMIDTDKYGKYHATNDGFCSWYEFSCEIFKQAAEKDTLYKDISVAPVSSDVYPAKAKRPSNSRMSKSKLSENGFSVLPKWQDALSRFFDEIEV